jgi:prepilin-type N-terminal cleavage/methylation domain-containing protein
VGFVTQSNLLNQEDGIMKKTGFTLIELMIVVAIIAIIAAIAIPNLLRSQMSANEASAIGSLRTIVTAETQFLSSGSAISNNVPQYGTLNALFTAVPPFIDMVLGSATTPTKSGYSFIFAVGSSTAAPSFTCNANASTARSGSRNFFIDNSGVLTWLPQTDGDDAADSTSPALQ